MKYKEILPGEKLKPYVRCYFVFESETDVDLTDTVFPVGNMEIMFNLGDGIWRSAVNNTFHKTPPVELWGKITKPLAIQAKGKNTMLGIRFFAHSAAYFLNEEIREFNNQITDLRDVLGPSVRGLHDRLLNTAELSKRIELVESFLWTKLPMSHKNYGKIEMVGRVMNEMTNPMFVDNMEHIASRYNITARCLQKLFLQYAGVTPKLCSKIERFQQSLRLISKRNTPLTSIAYDCGYFDQSHFIREFKSFTGITPSAYVPESYPVTQVFANS
jgi:AraC-like DNA-binding protein